MTRPTQVNCCKHRQTWRAKDAVRLQPKWYAAKLSAFSMFPEGNPFNRDSEIRRREMVSQAGVTR